MILEHSETMKYHWHVLDANVTGVWYSHRMAGKKREVINGKLICSRCGRLKPPEEFGVRKSGSTGRVAACKVCMNLYQRSWRAANPRTPEEKEAHAEYERQYDIKWPGRKARRSRASGLKLKYGVTLEWYEAKLEEQGGVCAICKKPETVLNTKGEIKLLSIDHCHNSGRIRGLLCNYCNAGLGHFRDNSALLLAAFEYLEHTEETEVA